MRYVFVFIISAVFCQVFAQWRTVETITNPYIYSFHFNNSSVYAGTGDSLFISRDKGQTWSATNFLTVPPYTIAAITEFNSVLYAGSYGEGVYKSTDMGDTWSDFSEGLSGWNMYAYDFHISGDTLIMLTDGGGVYIRRLVDNSKWTALNNNLPSNISWTVHDICETSKRFIIGAGANSFFYVLDKGTSEWKDKKITYNGRDYPVPTALIAFDDVVLAGTRLGIFRSYDHGETWDSVGIRALPLGTVSFARNGNRIYAGLTNMSDFWVWYTDDSGDTWNILDHQFASLNQIYYYDNRLWAATNSGAMISGLLTDVNPEEPSSPGGFTLEQNFPNPFNPATTIRYSLNSQDAAHVILKVYDVLGNEITTLVNEEKQPGSYFVNYNAASLASGVYYYTVYITGTTGSVTISRKMIVMK